MCACSSSTHTAHRIHTHSRASYTGGRPPAGEKPVVDLAVCVCGWLERGWSVVGLHDMKTVGSIVSQAHTNTHTHTPRQQERPTPRDLKLFNFITFFLLGIAYNLLALSLRRKTHPHTSHIHPHVGISEPLYKDCARTRAPRVRYNAHATPMRIRFARAHRSLLVYIGIRIQASVRALVWNAMWQTHTHTHTSGAPSAYRENKRGHAFAQKNERKTERRIWERAHRS